MYIQGCIFCLTCSYPELTKDHVLTSAYVNIFRTVTRNAVNKSVWRKKDCFWLPLNKHTMNIFIQISNSPRTRARFSENQSAPRLENRKTSPCSPCSPNLLHVLVSWILGYHNLCSPGLSNVYFFLVQKKKVIEKVCWPTETVEHLGWGWGGAQP